MVNLSNLTIAIANSHYYSIRNSVQKSPSSNSLLPANVSSPNFTGLTPPQKPTWNLKTLVVWVDVFPYPWGGCFVRFQPLVFGGVTFHHSTPPRLSLPGSLVLPRSSAIAPCFPCCAPGAMGRGQPSRMGTGKLGGEVKCVVLRFRN